MCSKIAQLYLVVGTLWGMLLYSNCVKMKTSILSPPWKHCVQRMPARKSWQEFISPGYPKGITKQTQCSWIISAPGSRRIRIAFQTLNLTGGINNCFTQSVEFLEVQTASSMGKFCGIQRPSDYVTYGSQIRIDLRADTAAAGHEGFVIKYKLSRPKEVGGFKKIHSFKKGSSTPKKITKFASKPLTKVGGRVNLSQRKKLREKASKAKKPTNKNKSKLSRLPAYRPSRNFQPKQKKTPSTFQKKDKPISITVNDGKEEDGLQLWLILVIGISGGLFLIFVGVLSWLCFCRKRKDENASNETNKKLPLNSDSFSLQRRCDLPGEMATSHHIQNPTLRKTEFENYPEMDYPPPRRALKKYSSSLENSKMPYPSTLTNSVTRREQTTKDFNFDANKKTHPSNDFYNSEDDDDGFPFRSVSQNPRFSFSGDDEGYDTSMGQKDILAISTKKVPTLKRKLTQWEREEIKKNSRKL